MADKVIGVDFGGSGIKLAEIQTGKDSPEVLRQWLVPLERDLVRHGAIEPENVALVASVLKLSLSEHKVTTKDVIMGINSVQDVFANRTLTDWHDPKDFHKALAFDLVAEPKLLPGAPEGVALDAVIHRDFTDEAGKKLLDALLVGVNKEIVETQVQILQKAGLNVIGADLSGLAILRAVQTFTRPDGHLDVLVDVGQEVLTVLIHENGRPYALSLQKGSGGRDADLILEQALQRDNREFLERTKASPGADPKALRALEDYNFKVFTAVEKAISSYLEAHRLLSEVKPTIAQITLTGAGSLLPTLPETLSNSFRVPVDLARFDPSIGGEPHPFLQESAMSSSFTAAVGLAMGTAA